MEERTREETERYQRRTLERSIPELKRYLRAEMRVLDAGCGPGSITMDVAVAVDPGTVIGVDVADDRIEIAQQQTMERNIDNAEFLVASVYDLPFQDDVFDLVYSHAVLTNLIHPLDALVEQKRVVKPGGWVLAMGVRDYGFSSRYPSTPAVELLREGWARYAETLRAADQKTHSFRSRFLDPHAGRKCFGWFVDAGFSDIRSEIKVHEVLCGEDIAPEPDPADLVTAAEQGLSDFYQGVVSAGLIDRKCLAKARKELTSWRSLPHAFHFRASVLTAGRA